MFVVAVVLLSTLTAPLPGAEAYQAGMDAEISARWEDARMAYRQCAAVKGPLQSYAEVAAARCTDMGKAPGNPKKYYAARLARLPEGPWKSMAQLEHARALAALQEYQAALKGYDAILDITPLPWWMEAIAWERAELLLAAPGRQKEAYAWFSEYAHTHPYASKRREAAKLLLESTDPEDLAVAVLALLRSASYKDAEEALKTAPPALLNSKGNYLSNAEVQSLIFPKAWDDTTRARLTQLLEANQNQLWARVWLIHGMRTEARKKRFTASRELCRQLVAFFPEEREAAEGLWWLAQYLEGGNGDSYHATVQELYLEITEKFPEHYRGDDACMQLGELALEAGENKQALACFTAVLNQYPDSRFAVDAALHCAKMRSAEKDDKGTLLFMTRAVYSGFGNYYGHLALDDLYNRILADTPRSGRLPVFQPGGYLQCTHPLKPRPPLPDAVIHDPRIQRAFFFGRHGMPEGEWEAGALCSALKDHADPAPYYQALAEAGYAHTVWQFAGDSGKSAEALRLRYPRAYWPVYQAMAKETGVDPYLLLAISRQESTFRASIRSSAGATGVMQLMPATARWMISVEDEIKKEHADRLTSPENSIRLGAYYLRRMLERSDGNLVYALASYNAGPGNCNKWKRRWPNASMEVFVENIPFSETKGYVKKVLGNYAAYKSLYGLE